MFFSQIRTNKYKALMYNWGLKYFQSMSGPENREVKAQEWIIMFDGKIKRSEKKLSLPKNKD